MIKLIATAQGIEIIQFHSDHNQIDALLGQPGKGNAFASQEFMTSMFKIIQIGGIVHHACQVTLVITNREFQLELIIFQCLLPIVVFCGRQANALISHNEMLRYTQHHTIRVTINCLIDIEADNMFFHPKTHTHRPSKWDYAQQPDRKTVLQSFRNQQRDLEPLHPKSWTGFY